MSHDYNGQNVVNQETGHTRKALHYIYHFEAFQKKLWFIWSLTLTVMSSLDIDVVCDNKLYGVNVSQVFSLFFSPVPWDILKRFPRGYYPWQCLLNPSLIISCISKALTHKSFLRLNNMNHHNMLFFWILSKWGRGRALPKLFVTFS